MSHSNETPNPINRHDARPLPIHGHPSTHHGPAPGLDNHSNGSDPPVRHVLVRHQTILRHLGRQMIMTKKTQPLPQCHPNDLRLRKDISCQFCQGIDFGKHEILQALMAMRILKKQPNGSYNVRTIDGLSLNLTFTDLEPKDEN